MNKIFFCDIDDTLVGKDKIISDKNLQSINKWLDDKNLFVLTSGRGVVGIENFAKDYDFSKYYIACNGAIIYDKVNSRVLHNDYIPKNLVKLLYDYGIENNIIVYVHSMYNTETTLIEEDIYQVTYILEEPFEKESLDKVRNFVNNYKEVQIIHDYHNQYKNYYLFDINLKDNSKGLAIKRLLEYLNIDKSNSFAIGNGNNDISMTYYVDKMFAVDNACEDLKKVVLKTVSSNNNDGVSEAIDILMGGEYE
jgi:hypothetical protein